MASADIQRTDGDAVAVPAEVLPGVREPEVNKLFRMVMKYEASDLHLKVGLPPMMRLRGDIRRADMRPLTQEDMERLLLPLLSARQRKILDEEGGVDLSYVVGRDECRFRVSLFKQRNRLSLVSRRVNTTIPTFDKLGLPPSIEKLSGVLDQGGDAVKFFVQLRADRPAPGAGEPDLVAETLAACQEAVDDGRAAGVPVVVENLVYALPGQELAGRAREDAIIEAARALNHLDIDLLKLEYPGSPEGCRRLAAVLDRPWAVLSAGVPFEDFTEILRTAFDDGGASGFIAGRSVWREAVALDGVDRERFLWNVARPRLEELTEVAARYAVPWHKR